MQNGVTSVVGLMRPRTGALPTAIASPTRSDNRRNLSPPHLSAPHFSASHFSAIPIFISFRLFLLSPKNHLSVLSVSLKKEKKTKERDRRIPAFCGSDLDRPGTDMLPAKAEIVIASRSARKWTLVLKSQIRIGRTRRPSRTRSPG